MDLTEKPAGMSIMDVFNAPWKCFVSYEDGSYAYLWGETLDSCASQDEKLQNTHGARVMIKFLGDDEFFETGIPELGIGPSDVFAA